MQATDILDTKTKRLAEITALITALATISFGLPYLLLPALLFAGAIISNYKPTLGAWITAGASAWLSVFILPYGFLTIIHPPPFDGSGLIILLIMAMSFIVTAWCDIALVIRFYVASRK
jgi:hypothetical protein